MDEIKEILLDMQKSQNEMKHSILELKDGQNKLEQNLNKKIEDVREELKEDIGNVREELKEDIGNVKEELKQEMDKLKDEVDNKLRKVNQRLAVFQEEITKKVDVLIDADITRQEHIEIHDIEITEIREGQFEHDVKIKNLEKKVIGA